MNETPKYASFDASIKKWTKPLGGGGRVEKQTRKGKMNLSVGLYNCITLSLSGLQRVDYD